MIKSALDALSYAFFPKRCELCGEVICLDEVRCDSCKSAERITGDLCEKCGRSRLDCECGSKTSKPEYKAIAAPYYYENSIKTAVNRFKDYKYTELKFKMAEEISNCIKERFGEITFDIITYVPMTKSKERKRGYNQSKLLAQEVSKNLCLAFCDCLVKVRETSQQKRSGAAKRRINLHGAFDLKNGADVKGKTILIIDDVKTTGSTLNECSFVLNGYGAKAVYAAAFCVTNKKH